MADSPPPSPGEASQSLLVRPAGGVVVAPDEVFEYLGRLDSLVAELQLDAANLGYLARQHWAATAGRPGVLELDAARTCLSRATTHADELRVAVRVAMHNYAEVEQHALREQELLAAVLASWSRPALFGLLSFAVAVGPAIVSATFMWSLWASVTGTDPLGTASTAFTRAVNLSLTDPGAVRAIELATSDLDEAGLALLGLPPALTVVAGALGATGPHRGVPTSATTISMAGAPLGLLQETEVRITHTDITHGDASPQGAEQLFSRVPEGDGGPQVRIERYDADGMPPRYVVYVAPTETFSPLATGTPWDQTSNMGAVAGTSPGSQRAVELAMGRAGVTVGDEVVFVGYSQGGIVAAQLAGSDHWNAVGLASFGAPTGSIDIPPGLVGMDVRHSDDLLPALGGPHSASGVLQIEREAFPQGSSTPNETMPAHQRTAYEETARRIDRATSSEVRDQVNALDAFTGDYTKLPDGRVTTYLFRAERIAG